MDVVVRGFEDFLALRTRCKAVDTVLPRELNRRMRLAAKPLIAQTRKAAREQLPHRGGLAERVATSPQRVVIRTGRRTAGVRIVTTRHDTASTDRGRLRHPRFGHRDQWFDQSVTPGWWTNTLRRGAPVVRPQVIAAMETVARMVENADTFGAAR